MKPTVAVPAISLLVYRAYSRKSLTPLGVITAALTAITHAVHPWSAPFALLVVFYLAGTQVTKVKHDYKSGLTQPATGTTGTGDAQRNHTQVLANSVVATVLILLHTRILFGGSGAWSDGFYYFSLGRVTPAADVVVVGIVANYAAVAADTFSSELGILSKSQPRLITSTTLRAVPRGTNGGVTAWGIVAGVVGAFIASLTSAILLPIRLSPAAAATDDEWHIRERTLWTLALTTWGALGSILDSILGSLLQASVVDKRTGKVVEGTGGRKVLIHASSAQPGGTAEGSSSLLPSGPTEAAGSESVRLRQTEAVANAAALMGRRESVSASGGTNDGRAGVVDTQHESRRLESGRDWLDNNAVNVLMAGLMSLGGMGVAAVVWGVSLENLLGLVPG